jgi:hypothetical protein
MTIALDFSYVNSKADILYCNSIKEHGVYLDSKSYFQTLKF